MKTFVAAVVLVFVLAPHVSAQYRDYNPEAERVQAILFGRSYRRDVLPPYRGRYDPRWLYNLRELPPLEIEECQYVECAGRKGTFHSEEIDVVHRGQKTKATELHFRGYDSTHNPLREGHKTCRPVPSAGYVVRRNGFALYYRSEEIAALAR